MLRKTTMKLSLSLLCASVVSFILSMIIVMSFGSIGSKSASSSAKSSASSGIASASSSSIMSSSSTISHQSTVSPTASKSLYSSGGLISYPAGKVILGIICVLIFAALIYSSAWHEGERDPNRVKYGHMNKFMLKGLVAGLLAIIPYAILTTVFLVTNSMTRSVTSVIIGIIYRVANIQYIVFGDDFINIPIVCYLLLLVLPAFSTLGYLAGYHNFVIISKIIYKNQKKPDGTYRKSISELKK